MLAVPLTEAEIRPRLGESLWVAAVNSPQATVVGGREDAIQRLEEELQKVEVGDAPRRVVNGSHTPLLDPVKAAPEAAGRGNPARAAADPDAVQCHRLLADRANPRTPSHWGEHMCGTLRFEQGVGELLRGEEQILLEVGPGAGLGAMVRQHARCGRRRWAGCWQPARRLGSSGGAGTRGRRAGTALGGGSGFDWEGYFAGENAAGAAAGIPGGRPRHRAEPRPSASHGEALARGIAMSPVCWIYIGQGVLDGPPILEDQHRGYRRDPTKNQSIHGGAFQELRTPG